MIGAAARRSGDRATGASVLTGVARLVCCVAVVAGNWAIAGADDAAAGKPREVTILAAADPAHRNFHSDSRQRIERIVAAASRHFEGPFGLKFRVARHRPWQYARGPRTDAEAMEMLGKLAPDGCQIVVGFTLHAYDRAGLRGGEARGVAAYFGQYALIPDQWTERTAGVRLVHELCHVFGAFHVADSKSIMQPSFSKGTPREVVFGDAVAGVLRLTRGVDLARGVESLDPAAAEKLRALYRRARHPSESAGNDPIVAGYRYQLVRAEQRGDAQRAAAMRAKIVALGGELPQQTSRAPFAGR